MAAYKESKTGFTVVKNGKTRFVTHREWDILGTDKYGWEPMPETPKEVAAIEPPTEPEPTPGRKPNKKAQK